MIPTSREPLSSTRRGPLDDTTRRRGSVGLVRSNPRTAAAALAAAVLIVPAPSAAAAPTTESPLVDVEACTAQSVDQPVVLPFSFTFYGDSHEEVGSA